MVPCFIIVDDDSINNLICLRIIRKAFPEADVQIFTDAGAALSYTRAIFNKSNASDVILFLDINMPIMTGWEFLESFDFFETEIKKHVKIYMLSSSIDASDKERVAGNKNVLDYLEKPLTAENVKKVLGRLS